MANQLELLLKAKNETDAAFNAMIKSLKQAEQGTKDANGAMKKLASEGVDSVSASASNFSSKLGTAGSLLSAMGPGGLAAAAGLGATAAAATAVTAVLVSAVKAAADYADRLKVLEASTGIGTKSLQALDVAAKLGNTSLENLSQAVGRMQKEINDGSADFAKLGLKLSDLKRMAPDEALKKVATAIQSIENHAERAAARIAIFGKSGNELADALGAVATGAGEMGGALSDDAIEASAELADEMDLLDTAMERVKVQFGAAIAQSPELRRALEDLTKWVANLATDIGKATPKVIEFFDTWVTRARATVAALNAGKGFIADVLGGSSVTGAAAAAAGKFQAEAYIDAYKKAIAKMKDQIGIGTDPTFGGGKGSFAGAEADAKAAAAAKAAIAAMKKREAEHKASLKRQEADEKSYADAVTKESWRLEREVTKVMQSITDKHAKEILERFLDEQEANRSNAERARESMEEMAAAISEARGRAFDGWADGLHQAVDIMDALGISAESGLGKMVGLMSGTADMIANAAQRGYLTIADLVNQASQIFQSGSVLGGAASGAMTGFAVGGPIGAGIGAIAGGLLGLFGGAKKAREEMQKLKNEFISSMGGMTSLAAKAKEAGITLDAMFKAKSAEQLKKAIGDIKNQLDLWQEGNDKIKAAMDEFGLTIEQMGPKFAQQELDKTAAHYAEAFEILKIAGGDVNAIAEQMGPKVLDLVHQYQAAGLAIPEALRPVLEAMLKNGDLVDENGEAYTSLEDAGIKFAESMTDAMKGLMEQVQELVRVLARGFNVPVSINYSSTGSPPPGGGNHPPKDNGNIPEYAEGGPTGPGGLAMLHANEYVLSSEGLKRMERILGSAMEMARSNSGGGGSIPDVYLEKTRVGRVVFRGDQYRRAKRRGMRA